MANWKTHFEQVPLTVVKKIVEEQDHTETMEENPGIKKEKQKRVRSEAERQSIAPPLMVAQARL